MQRPIPSQDLRVRALTAVVAGLMVLLVACSVEEPTAAPTPTAPERSEVTAEACLVRIHGRSETGADPVARHGFAEVSPTGNSPAGEGHEWVYDTDESYREARDLVVDWIDAVSCDRVVLNGFSNGGGFVGALYCRGEDFGGRLVGVVIDDPVPDDAVEACQPASDVPVGIYWTGALTEAEAGVACDDIGYTCAGETLLGIDAYAAALDVDVQTSPNEDHVWFRDAPELQIWLRIGSR